MAAEQDWKSLWSDLWGPDPTVYLTVDATTLTAEPCRMPAMLGLRINTDFADVGAALPYFEVIGPTVCSVGIEFDGHLEPPPFSSAVGWLYGDSTIPYAADTTPTAWLTGSLIPIIAGLQMTCWFQVAGAPPQASYDIAVKPAAHPSPENMPVYVEWVHQYWDPTKYPAGSYRISPWNEPGHTMRDVKQTLNQFGEEEYPGETQSEYYYRRSSLRELAATEFAQVAAEQWSVGTDWTQCALGSHLSGDFSTGRGRGSVDETKNFIELSLEAYDAYQALHSSRDLEQFSFTSYNGRYYRPPKKWDAWNNDRELPMVIPQYAPYRNKSKAEQDWGVLTQNGAAVDMMTDMVYMMEDKGVEDVCRSYVDFGKIALIARDDLDQIVGPTLSWWGMRWLSMLLPERGTVTGADQVKQDRKSLGVHAVCTKWGSGVVRLLVWNDAVVGKYFRINSLTLPSTLAGVAPTVKYIGPWTPEPVDYAGPTTPYIMEHESALMFEWTLPGAEDPLEFRNPMAPALFRGAPHTCSLPTNEWGKFDQVRGIAYIYSRAGSSAYALARYQNLPQTIYIRPKFYNMTTGNFRVRLFMVGGPNKNAVDVDFSTVVDQTLTIDLDSQDAGWAATTDRAIEIQIRLVNADDGASAVVQMRTTPFPTIDELEGTALMDGNALTFDGNDLIFN